MTMICCICLYSGKYYQKNVYCRALSAFCTCPLLSVNCLDCMCLSKGAAKLPKCMVRMNKKHHCCTCETETKYIKMYSKPTLKQTNHHTSALPKIFVEKYTPADVYVAIDLITLNNIFRLKSF